MEESQYVKFQAETKWNTKQEIKAAEKKYRENQAPSIASIRL